MQHFQPKLVKRSLGTPASHEVHAHGLHSLLEFFYRNWSQNMTGILSTERRTRNPFLGMIGWKMVALPSISLLTNSQANYHSLGFRRRQLQRSCQPGAESSYQQQVLTF
uniref:hypothetical protein n=1 Tax=Arthrobacter sp. TaxID=1667 RepID=UPI00159EC9D5|nr:hypothetical protein [Arthrobacter sp.]